MGDLKNTEIREGFLSKIRQRTLKVTLPMEYDQLERTGRIASLRCEWEEGQPQKPHFFWDSDIAKWIEAASYSLLLHWDEQLLEKIRGIISMIEEAQWEDGYFNIYYTVVEPGQRFSYVKRKHELYCLGHMIEAAVALHQVTGEDRLLNVVCRYTDLVCGIFGTEEGKIPGYDGHPEIELALVKLYDETGNEKYLELCRFFIDQRGTEPHFYEWECEKRGEPVEQREYRIDRQGRYAYYLAHEPVRRQKRAVGHAVRAMYLYCGMADLAGKTKDNELLDICREIWDNVAYRQMYITGGIGPESDGERFSYDYHLPNLLAYNETCASIGLFLFSHRLWKVLKDGRYADVMETCLFNTILGGASESGDRFFYSNPLSATKEAYDNIHNDRPQMQLARQEWFDVACCPPNFARLILSLQQYIFGQEEERIWINQYINSSLCTFVYGKKVTIAQKNDYPWDGGISVSVELMEPETFTIFMRVPQWCMNYRLAVNNISVSCEKDGQGYIGINRTWHGGDHIKLMLDMPVQAMEAHPGVASDCGRCAIQRGPVVYCLEETDNGRNLEDLAMDISSMEIKNKDRKEGEYVAIKARGCRRKIETWQERTLYRAKQNDYVETDITAVPFYYRLNRDPGEIAVWIRTM